MFLAFKNGSSILALLLIALSGSGIAPGRSEAEDKLPTQGAELIYQPPSQNQTTGQAGSQQPERVEIEELSGEVYNHLALGNKFSATGRYDEGIAEYKLALERARRPVFTVCLALGSAYFDKKDFKSAADAYRQAIAAKPNDFRGHFNLGQSLYELSDYAAAEQAYRRALGLNPRIQEPQILECLGLCLYNQKRLDEAIAEYKLAIDKAKGKYSEAYYNLGIALMERGDLPGSEGALRNAIDQDKHGFPEAHYNLGLVLEKEGHVNEAVEQYEAYLRSRPDATNAASLRQHIDRLLKKK